MDRKGCTVLVVEDNPVMMKMYHPMLERLGFKTVLTANNGAEAWEILSGGGRTIDLVVSDLVMPKMNGRELLHKVRGSDSLWDTPFIIITVEENTALLASIEPEVDACLIKPFTPVLLESEIDRVLARKFNPSPYQAALAQARRLMAQGGDHDEALAALQTAINLQPQEATPYYLRGILLEGQGKLAESKLYLEKCITLQPTYPKPYDLLASIHRRGKNYAAERQTLLQIDRLAPPSVERSLYLALACARVNDHDGVRNALKTAARHAAPDDQPAFEKAFRIYLQCRMLAEAEVLYKKHIDPGLATPRLLNKFALLFKGVKAHEPAILFLERIVHLWRTVKNHGIPAQDMAVYYFNLAVAMVEQANTLIDPEAKKAVYAAAEKLAGKATDCDLNHEDAAKLYRWLSSQNA